MNTQLGRLFEQVLDGEPALRDEVDEVFRRADRLRRRRTHALIGAGAAAAVTIAAAGYLLTTTLVPAGTGKAPAAGPSSAAPLPSAVADPVLAIVAPLVDGEGMHIFPRPPERGHGWRLYSVAGDAGEPRGTVEIAIYHSPEDLCFPVPDKPGECSRTEWAPRGIEYVRYEEEDADRRVHQTVARRISDGRTVAVMAAGEREGSNAEAGRPALTGAQVEQIATDPRLADAFAPAETCTGPWAAGCPEFRVPVPVGTGRAN